MREALIQARLAFSAGETPVGAVITSRDGEIIGRGRNRRESAGDIAAHAEIEALRSAASAIGSWRIPGASLYVTLEPCPMCAFAIMQARIARIIYGARDPSAGAVTGRMNLFIEYNAGIQITGGILKNECGKLLSDFFDGLRKK